MAGGGGAGLPRHLGGSSKVDGGLKSKNAGSMGGA